MSNSSETKGVTMNELEQRMANVRHEYAIYVDWLYEERKEEFDRLINAVKAEALREASEALDAMQTPDAGLPADVRRDPALWLMFRADELDPHV